MPVGTAGVNSAAIEGLGVWSTLDTSDWGGQISAVVVNTAHVDRYIQNNEILGLFDPVKEESLSVESDEEKINAIFNSFKEIRQRRNQMISSRLPCHLKKKTSCCLNYE